MHHNYQLYLDLMRLGLPPRCEKGPLTSESPLSFANISISLTPYDYKYVFLPSAHTRHQTVTFRDRKCLLLKMHDVGRRPPTLISAFPGQHRSFSFLLTTIIKPPHIFKLEKLFLGTAGQGVDCSDLISV